MNCPHCNAIWPDNMAVSVDASVYWTFTFIPHGYVKHGDVNTYDDRTIHCTECQYDTSGYSPEHASDEAWQWANTIGDVTGNNLSWGN